MQSVPVAFRHVDVAKNTLNDWRNRLRTNEETNQKSSIDVEVPLEWTHNNHNFRSEFDISHVYSIVPRLKVVGIPQEPTLVKLWKQFITQLKKLPIIRNKESELSQKNSDKLQNLQVGDIIVKTAQVENPTFEQLRKITIEHEDKDMPISVLSSTGEKFPRTAFLIPLSRK